MLYNLKDLNQKSADVECIQLIRDLKRNSSLPLTEEKVKNAISPFFIFPEEIKVMEASYILIEPLIKDTSSLLNTKNANDIYEKISIARACTSLKEIPLALLNNIEDAKQKLVFQQTVAAEATNLFIGITKARSDAEKQDINAKLNKLFGAILRTEENFVFNSYDIVHEAQIVRMKDLVEEMNSGFIFHVKLGEYIKKQDINEIKKRAPQEDQKKIDEIIQKMIALEKGVDMAYAVNMKMMNLAIMLYAYVKWLSK